MYKSQIFKTNHLLCEVHINQADLCANKVRTNDDRFNFNCFNYKCNINIPTKTTGK